MIWLIARLVVTFVTIGLLDPYSHGLALVALMAVEVSRAYIGKKMVNTNSLLGLLLLAMSPIQGMVTWWINGLLNLESRVLKRLIRSSDGKLGAIYSKETYKKTFEKKQPSIIRKTAYMLDWPIIEDFFRVELDFQGPSVATDGCIFEYDDISDPEIREKLELSARNAAKRDWALYIVGFVIILNSILVANIMVVVLLPLTILLTTWSREVQEDKYNDGDNFEGPDGLYRVTRMTLFGRAVIGVAYAEQGTVYSKLHVHSGNISYNDVSYGKSFVSEREDLIAWGGRPRVHSLKAGDHVVVEILPTNSYPTIVFSSVVGEMKPLKMFASLPTRPGVSGSPIFRVDKQDGDVVMRFAGCYGNSLEGDFKDELGRTFQVELVQNVDIGTDSTDVITHGSYYQSVKHPGAGKTRSLIPEICKRTDELVERIVVLAPTVVVAREFANVMPSAGTMFRGGKNNSRFSKVQIMAHATALSLMVNNKYPFKTRRLGYIIDESHVKSTKTLCLIEAIRHRIREEGKGYAVEMSATCVEPGTGKPKFDRGSNYNIQEVVIHDPLAQHVLKVCRDRPGQRIVLFVGTVRGKGNSMAYFRRELHGKINHKIICTHRTNYAQAMDQIAEENPQGVLIITTSISECGANYNADIVIDTMEQLEYVVSHGGELIRAKILTISDAQMIQRRGRVGRRREGEYHYPASRMMQVREGTGLEGTAEEEDLRIFKNSMYGGSGLTLTERQITVWLGSVSDEMEYHSPRLVDLLHSKSGIPFTQREIMARTCRYLLGGQHSIIVRGKKVKVQWWDDRDRILLEKLVSKVLDIPIPVDADENAVEIMNIQPRLYTTRYARGDPNIISGGIPLDMIPEVSHIRRVTGIMADSLVPEEPPEE